MTYHIVACGETAKHWDGSGPSIGVNDASMWGHPLDYLLVINHPSKFSNEPDRFSKIINTKPRIQFYCHTTAWKQYFQAMKHLATRQYTNLIRKGTNYHSKTSPFAAISLAWNLGATDIVLWGVDFANHKFFSPGKKEFNREIRMYQLFTDKLRKQGCNVFCGAEGSQLKFLPIWNCTR